MARSMPAIAVRLLFGTLFVLFALGLTFGVTRALRSRFVVSAPLPIRVLLQAVGFTATGVVVAAFAIFALIAYSGSGIGDPCPPYC
jgi:hypothetical protein